MLSSIIYGYDRRVRAKSKSSVKKNFSYTRKDDLNDFFSVLDDLIQKNGITIDRPKDSVHPRFPDFIYLLDYGYINETASQDGSGIDIFRGDDPEVGIVGIICTIDSLKKDSEIKVLYQCTEENIQTALSMMNQKYLRGILVRK